MEAVQGPLSANYSDELKIAVNAYHLSVGHHGPYDVVLNGNLSLPLEITCIWPDSKILNNDHECTYICDAASLDRLQRIIGKLTILDRGFAWPHVNLSAEPFTVDWIMFREDVRNSSGFPGGKEWFIVSEHVRELLDYNVSQHNLLPARFKATCIHPVFGSHRDVSLSLVIIDPGDLAVSILQSPCSEENCATSSDSPYIHRMCVAGDNIAICNRDEMWTKSELKHHNVTSQIPTFLLQSIIAHACKGRISDGCEKHESFLHSEVTIKDEPLVSDVFSSRTDRIDSPTEKNVTASLSLKRRKQVWQMPITRGCAFNDENFTVRGAKCTRLLGKVLQCPKCNATFKYGLTGLNLLLGHIYDDHKRLSSYCTLIIKQKYRNLLKQSVKCGNSYFCNAL